MVASMLVVMIDKDLIFFINDLSRIMVDVGKIDMVNATMQKSVPVLDIGLLKVDYFCG